jgi:hypothetical protein
VGELVPLEQKVVGRLVPLVQKEQVQLGWRKGSRDVASMGPAWRVVVVISAWHQLREAPFSLGPLLLTVPGQFEGRMGGPKSLSLG